MSSPALFKRSLLLVLAFVIGVGAFLPLFTATVSANINEVSPEVEAQSASYYRTLRTCINNEMQTTIQLSASDDGVAKPSKWFTDNEAYGYVYPDGKMDCKTIMPKALALWGWGDSNAGYKTFLEILGFKYDASNARWTVANRDQLRNKFDSAVQAKYYGINFAGEPVQSGAARYAMFLNVFQKACSAKSLGAVASITNSSYKSWLDDSNEDIGHMVSSTTANISGLNDSEGVYFSKVNTIQGSGADAKVVPTGYAYIASTNAINAPWNKVDGTAKQVKIYGYHNSAVERTCHEIQKGVSENAGAYLAYARANPTAVPPDTAIDTTVPPEDKDAASSCSIEGVGWILCPVLTFTAGIVDGAYNFVSGLLVVQPLLTTGGTQGAYQAWLIMRNVANVAFVIAFLIIIFSQLTGVALSNYGVKKLLPRLVIAAILVNVSFWVCAIAIDLSNIIGASVVTVFDSVGANIGDNLTDTANTFNGGDVWTNMAGTVLAVGAVAGVAYYATLSAFIPALLAAVVAIVTVFLVLTLRQALIILLIVVSPLAFVAYLLPNTEDLFSKWRKLFTTLLLMYPIIAGIFGASALASMIIMQSSPGNFVVQIMGACIAILPLAITPVVMKTAGGLLNRFGGIVNNAERGPIDRLKKAGEGYGNTRKELRNTRALNGGKGSFQGGRGAFVRWRSRRGAIDSGVKAQRGRVEQQYIAGAMTKDDNATPTAFANKAAGGTTKFDKSAPGLLNKVSVTADPAALQRALAGAKFTIEKAEVDDIKAEQSLVSNLDMVALKNELAKPSSSNARSAAIVDRMIKIGEPVEYMDAVNQFGSNKSPEVATTRQSIANSLREHGPQFLKAPDLDNIATGSLGGSTLASIAHANIKQGVYSEEKLVNESNANIKFAFESADLEGKQRMVNTAASLKSNETLKGKIKHNVKSIDNLAAAKAPDTQDAP